MSEVADEQILENATIALAKMKTSASETSPFFEYASEVLGHICINGIYCEVKLTIDSDADDWDDSEYAAELFGDDYDYDDGYEDEDEDEDTEEE